jgi:hypothetical protein
MNGIFSEKIEVWLAKAGPAAYNESTTLEFSMDMRGTTGKGTVGTWNKTSSGGSMPVAF